MIRAALDFGNSTLATSLAMNTRPRWVLPQRLSGQEAACSSGAAGDVGVIPGLGRSPEGGHGNPLTPLLLAGEFHGQKSLVAIVQMVAKSWT